MAAAVVALPTRDAKGAPEDGGTSVVVGVGMLVVGAAVVAVVVVGGAVVGGLYTGNTDTSGASVLPWYASSTASVICVVVIACVAFGNATTSKSWTLPGKTPTCQQEGRVGAGHPRLGCAESRSKRRSNAPVINN